MKVFLIDAYDSFVFIISQYLQTLGLETKVVRNDTPHLRDAITQFSPDFLVLGPGPGHPREAGYVELIQHYEKKLPMLGVCLGHQAIGMAYGAEVDCAENIMHGKVSTIHNDGKGVYAHTQAQPMTATRYHSLIIKEETLPKELIITSRSADDHYIMGVRHLSYPIEGVQFHPESILTEKGLNLFRSFINSYCKKVL